MSSSPEWLGGRIQYKELHALPSSPAVEGVQDLGRPPLHRGAGRQPPSPVVDVLLRPGGRRAISWLAVLVQKALLDHQLLLTRLEDGQGVQVTTVSTQSRSHNHTHTQSTRNSPSLPWVQTWDFQRDCCIPGSLCGLICTPAIPAAPDASLRTSSQYVTPYISTGMAQAEIPCPNSLTRPKPSWWTQGARDLATPLHRALNYAESHHPMVQVD